MITYKEALEIALKEKNKLHTPAKLNYAKDCGNYWRISYYFHKPNGDKIQTYGLKMAYEIDKKTGSILDLPPYPPGSSESKKIRACENLPIPEEYKEL